MIGRLSFSDIKNGLNSLNMKRGLFRLWCVASIVWMFVVAFANIDDVTYWFNYQFRYSHLVELTNEETATRIKVLETGSYDLEKEYDGNLPVLFPDGKNMELGHEERITQALELLRSTPPKPYPPNNTWLKGAFLWPLIAILLSPMLYWVLPFILRCVIAPLLWIGKGFSRQNTP